jgi:hypothetical protein
MTQLTRTSLIYIVAAGLLLALCMFTNEICQGAIPHILNGSGSPFSVR